MANPSDQGSRSSSLCPFIRLRRRPRLRAVTPVCRYALRRAGTVSQTADAVGHSLWRRTMNTKRVPFEALNERGRICFGGFRPPKRVEEPGALDRLAPILMKDARG